MELCHTVAMRHSYIVTNYVASKWSYIATICNKISILLPSNQMTFCTGNLWLSLQYLLFVYQSEFVIIADGDY